MRLSRHITLREFAKLTIGSSLESSLDYVEISIDDFNYLYNLNNRIQFKNSLDKENKSKIFSLSNRETLKVKNFVGVIRTPSNTVIEILPKIYQMDTEHELKEALFDMILVSQNISPKCVDKANLKSKDNSLSDWIEVAFLNAFEKIIRTGIKQDYFDIEEEQFFLKGKLNIKKHIRNIGIKDHVFSITHNSLELNNPENRLLKLAFKIISNNTRNIRRKIICNKYQSLMSKIPYSNDIEKDFNQWRNNKLIAHYQDIKPLCDLILKQKNPLATNGTDEGLSLLFPMEKLFESYVKQYLGPNLKSDFNLSKSVSSKFLLTQNNKELFNLKPDFTIQFKKNNVLLLDAKWKIIDSNVKKYSISQQDIYQMYAYSHHFLNFKEKIILIYPATRTFQEPLDPFIFSSNTEDPPILLVVPFDLKNKKFLWDKEKCEGVDRFFNIP